MLDSLGLLSVKNVICDQDDWLEHHESARWVARISKINCTLCPPQNVKFQVSEWHDLLGRVVAASVHSDLCQQVLDRRCDRAQKRVLVYAYRNAGKRRTDTATVKIRRPETELQRARLNYVIEREPVGLDLTNISPVSAQRAI